MSSLFQPKNSLPIVLIMSHGPAGTGSGTDGRLAFKDGAGELPTEVVIERPKNREHGDWATNVAMQLSPILGLKPRELAELVAPRIQDLPEVSRVEIAGPGVSVSSTWNNGGYNSISGTSMASPEVAGIATLIRSYYPQLSASQVKHIIMNSGVKVNLQVLVPGLKGEKAPFSSLSKAGSIANAYNALLLADKMVN